MITSLGTSGSSAAAEPTTVASVTGAAATEPLPDIAQPGSADAASQQAPVSAPADPPSAIAASSLEQLVAAQGDAPELSGELKCLAGAIYFEARSESLEGQLAVGRVIIARTRSGRFPANYCGVVYQPAQFPWARRQAIPSVDVHSPLWHRAVTMARIADAGSWQSPAEGALFFHAARVSTNWRMTRVAQIDHHIFYR